MKNIIVFVLSMSIILCPTMIAVGQESANEPTTIAVRVEPATKTDVENIGKKLDEMDEKIGRLGEKIDRVDAKIDEKVGKIDAKIDEKIGKVDAKIDTVVKDTSYISGQINAVKWGVGIIISVLVVLVTAFGVWIAYKKFKKTESIPRESAPSNESNAQAQEPRPPNVEHNKPPTTTRRRKDSAPPPKPSAPATSRPHTAVEDRSKLLTGSEKQPKK